MWDRKLASVEMKGGMIQKKTKRILDKRTLAQSEPGFFGVVAVLCTVTCEPTTITGILLLGRGGGGMDFSLLAAVAGVEGFPGADGEGSYRTPILSPFIFSGVLLRTVA